jgi:hypothetical protein
MKIGQKVQLKIRRMPEQLYKIVYIGPHSVKLEDEDGDIHIIKKSKVRYQLYGLLKDDDRASSSVDTISVPMGGQPNTKKK